MKKVKKYTSGEILELMDTAFLRGNEFLTELLEKNGGFIDTQNFGKKNDSIYGIYLHQADGVQKEVHILAVKLEENDIHVFCGLTELSKVAYTREEMEERFVDIKKEDDCGFWERLSGSELWALPTMQSILEAIEQYV